MDDASSVSWLLAPSPSSSSPAPPALLGARLLALLSRMFANSSCSSCSSSLDRLGSSDRASSSVAAPCPSSAATDGPARDRCVRTRALPSADQSTSMSALACSSPLCGPAGCRLHSSALCVCFANCSSSARSCSSINTSSMSSSSMNAAHCPLLTIARSPLAAFVTQSDHGYKLQTRSKFITHVLVNCQLCCAIEITHRRFLYCWKRSDVRHRFRSELYL